MKSSQPGDAASLRSRETSDGTRWDVMYRTSIGGQSRQRTRVFSDPKAATLYQTLVRSIGGLDAEQILTALDSSSGQRGGSRQTGWFERDQLRAAAITERSWGNQALSSPDHDANAVNVMSTPLSPRVSLPSARTAHGSDMSNLLTESVLGLSDVTDQISLANYLRTSPRVLTSLVKDGRLLAVPRGGQRAFRLTDVLNLLTREANTLARGALDQPGALYTARELREVELLPDFSTVSETAAFLSYSEYHVKTLCRSSELAATKAGKFWIVPRAGLAAFAFRWRMR